MPSSRFQPSFAAGVLGPGLHGRVDLAKYDVGLRKGKNVFVHAHGGISNRAGTEFVTEVPDSSKLHRLIPFKRDEDENLIMLMGDQTARLIYRGAVVQDGGSDYAFVTPFSSVQLQAVDYVQSVDVMFMAHPDMFPKRMERTGATTWTFADIAIDPNIAAPTGLNVAQNNSGSETYTYKVSPVVDGVEGFPSAEASVVGAQDLDVSGAFNLVTWSGTAEEYNVYREVNGVFGYIGFTTDQSFRDDNFAPDLTTTPVEAAGIFTGPDEYPGKVSLYQQRLVFGGSKLQPETLWMSRIGDFANFTRSRILRDDDRIELDLTGDEVNFIRGMLQLRELLVFSSSGEFSITGPNGALIASNPIQTKFAYSGSREVKPLVVEDTALFVDRTGRSVRDLRYAFEQDGYSGNDLTIFASHFFEGRQIAGWAFVKNPYSIVWAYLDNGKLLSFTYKREHQVWAWTEHDVGGEVESLASVSEGTDDALYLIVRREINGQTKRYVERLHERLVLDSHDAFFVDCGLKYSGAPLQTVSGLGHLEGKTVSALADGFEVTGLVVTGGQVTLPRAASKISVGLPYVSEIETLPPAIQLRDLGDARGRPHKIPSVYIQLEKTRGIKVGPVSGTLSKVIQTPKDLSQREGLFTGLIRQTVPPKWSADGTIRIVQEYPLPMTILGVNPEISIGRSG